MISVSIDGNRFFKRYTDSIVQRKNIKSPQFDFHFEFFTRRSIVSRLFDLYRNMYVFTHAKMQREFKYQLWSTS